MQSIIAAAVRDAKESENDDPKEGKKPFLVYLEESILYDLDALCEKAQMSRSAFVRDLLTRVVNEANKPPRLPRKAKKALRKKNGR